MHQHMDEDDQHKEVYAHFGLAIFMAQVLEHEIVNALICCDLVPTRRGQILTQEEWGIEVNRFTDGQFEKTMGKLIKIFRVAMEVSGELEEHLATSLHERNFLVHSYFRERADFWLTQDGRQQMLKELRAARDLFHATSQLLEAALQPLMLRYGLTEDAISRYVEEYKFSRRSGRTDP